MRCESALLIWEVWVNVYVCTKKIYRPHRDLNPVLLFWVNHASQLPWRHLSFIQMCILDEIWLYRCGKQHIIHYLLPVITLFLRASVVLTQKSCGGARWPPPPPPFLNPVTCKWRLLQIYPLPSFPHPRRWFLTPCPRIPICPPPPILQDSVRILNQ